MNANEKRAEEVVAACSRASYEGIDPRSVILIALASAERRGEDRVLREMRSGVCGCNGDERTPHATQGISCVDRAIKVIRARRARGGRRGV